MRALTVLFVLGLVMSACDVCPRTPGLDSSQCAALPSLSLPTSLPTSATNRVADDEKAALLGFSLFFDARLSADETQRCATCHIPERLFGDGRPLAVGIAPVDRNSPSILTAAWHRWQMWDGKADSLWSQPLLAFENEREMNFTRLEIAHFIASTYREPYQALFGPLPALEVASRFPPRGKPGEAAFDDMTESDQLEINRVVANVGKTLEAYMRKAAHRRGRFDAFVDGDSTALTANEQRGLAVFMRAGCDGCHSGSRFSDDAFHVTGVPPTPGKPVERARALALEKLAASPFTASGPFSDAPSTETYRPTAADEGAYRTPTLRNVSRTGPWGHNGTFVTLGDIVDFELRGGEGSVDSKLKPVSLSPAERDSLLAFLAALDAEDPPSPWNNWPDR